MSEQADLQARMDAIEQRMQSTGDDIEAQLAQLIEIMQVVLDALTYMSGAIERLRADLFQERGWRA